ncbi:MULTISPECIES: dihydroorotase [unclassified Shinella]|uniref:dihydroorotase n=1 Tax=unclassified Shinella TaxID=2643062 RepID=UPI00225CACF7|nr:amidohydrolase family protein [Shinella sp. YE25]MDC7258848.1 amidohydrolase family protein [Shinella sp. YE25]CAI0334375.1 Dihydroorotase [Rhizobiaceae bacterium]CAK7260558.1 Dihydroorotase [Shinella sp. WSC3-e]
MMLDLVLKNAQIALPGGDLSFGAVGVKDGRIAVIAETADDLAAREMIDCGGLLLLPGVVDPHVHFDFGNPETDFETESRASALGGTTSILSFHRSKDIRDSFPVVKERAERQSCIDFGLHFGLTSQLHVETLEEIARRFGVTSFKLYMMYKGAAGAAKGFTEIDDALLYTALRATAAIPGAVMGVHCENVEVIPVLRPPLKAAGRNDLKAWNEQSPGFLEAENVFRVCYFAAQTGTPVNIVHMSASDSLEIVRQQRKMRGRSGPPIHVETCPHYLVVDDEWPAGVLAKVNPPVRGRADIEALWEGVFDGSVTTIGSDHVARKCETKDKDIWGASAGFPGSGLLLPLMLHEGYHRRGLPLSRIVELTSANAARIYNMPSKGAIAVGKDADLLVVDPDLERTVDHAVSESYSDYSPYQGMRLKGWPVRTLVRGRTVMQDGRITEEARANPWGRYLERMPR